MLMFFTISMLIFLGLCLFLCMLILMQESKSMGLGGSSFGGDAGSSLFGTSTPLVLKKLTAYLIAIFFIACLFLSYWAGFSSDKFIPPVEQVEDMHD